MQSTLKIEKIPCFSNSDVTELSLRPVNFIYGPNGSGKSSLCKAIEAQSDQTSPDLRILLYNRDYRAHVIDSSNSLKGHIALGPEAVEAKAKLDSLANRKKKILDKIERASEILNGSPNGQTGKIEVRERIISYLIGRMWETRKSSIDDKIRAELYRGTARSKDNFNAEFKSRLIERLNTKTFGPLDSLSQINEQYLRLRQSSGEPFSLLVPPLHEDFDRTVNIAISLLEEKLVNPANSEYTSFAKDIDADWLARGFELLQQTSDCCPFCSRDIGADLLTEIKLAFESDYEKKINLLRKASLQLENVAPALEEFKSSLASISSLDLTSASEQTEMVLSDIRTLESQIRLKLKQPQSELSFTPSMTVADFLKSVNKANELISRFNQELADKDNIEKALRNRAANALLDAIDHEIEESRSDFQGTNKAINALEKQRKIHEAELNQTEKLIEDAARTARNAKVMVNWMNDLIGFFLGDAFSLEQIETDAEGNSFKVIRPDGSPAGQTLSEGEEQLLAFLYFISTIRNLGQDGSENAGASAVVIIDDPMSSLDSDLLYGVSTLMRELITDMKDGHLPIRQLTFSSHNSMFYKNLVFNYEKSDDRFQHFIIKKAAFGCNKVEEVDRSPVSTTYRELWVAILSASEDSDVVGLANTMRRVLETYFQSNNSLSTLRDIRGLDPQEKTAVNSLISWANDGSHNLFDSLEIGTASLSCATYNDVFKLIFTRTGHEAHYQMMVDAVSGGTTFSPSAQSAR